MLYGEIGFVLGLPVKNVALYPQLKLWIKMNEGFFRVPHIEFESYFIWDKNFADKMRFQTTFNL